MAKRNYTGLEGVKEYILGQMVPKYYNVDNINDLNAGLLGLTSDIQATIAEDSFNTLSLMAKEAFPSQAQLPETIFTNATFLDITDIMAQPANLNIALMVKISDILEHGEYVNEQIVFNLDSNMVIDIEGVNFMPDYDIIVTAKPHKNSHIFTAQYDMKYDNSISDVNIPYLKTYQMPIENIQYLTIFIKAHQTYRKISEEVIIDNDKINKSSIIVKYENDLASFDVLYREAGTGDYIPLQVVPYGSTPLKTPFCFYKLIDESSYEISFTIIDSYFQPDFNSDILITTHTTNGSKGVFRSYEGNKVSVKMSGDKYDYNSSIVVFAMPSGASISGSDRLSLEDLRYKVVEKWATSGAYNTENDLQTYLENYIRANDTHVTFVKKRDDMAYRMFSSFALFKDKLGDYYPTNTLNLDIYRSDFDVDSGSDGRSIIHSGSLFTYKSTDVLDLAVKTNGRVESPPVNPPEFLYTCPFAISVQKSPTIASFYLNSISQDITPDYEYVNNDSYYQFIVSSMGIRRNAIIGEKEYTLRASMVPSSTLPEELVTPNADGDIPFLLNTKVVAGIMSADGESVIAYKEMKMSKFSTADAFMQYECVFETNDVITDDERILINNIIKRDGTEGSITVPMTNTKFAIFAMYKNDDPNNINYKTLDIPQFNEYILTNTYSSDSTPINLMAPMNMIRSTAKFMPHTEEIEGVFQNSYYYNLDLVPLIDYRSVSTEENFKNYVTMLHDLHHYLSDIANKKTNNFGVDLKFYNTYGRSKNFTTGEENEHLDKVNIKIHFRVAVKIGVDTASLIPSLKAFIKDYVENINKSVDGNINMKGFNAIYISNLMQEIEANFDQVKYHRFIGINKYDSYVQVVENRISNFDNMNKDERNGYVPEYLTIREEDIIIEIIE